MFLLFLFSSVFFLRFFLLILAIWSVVITEYSVVHTTIYIHIHTHIFISAPSRLWTKVERINQRFDGEINQVAHNCGIVVHRFIANMQMNIIIEMNWSKDVCDNQRKQRAYTVHTAHTHNDRVFNCFIFTSSSRNIANLKPQFHFVCWASVVLEIAIAFQCMGPIIGVAHSNGANRKQ